VKRSTEVESVELRAFAVTVLIPRWMLSYIGAGTGSLIIQIVIAALLGGLFALKIYWRRIKAFFTRSKEDKERDAVPAGAAGCAGGEVGTGTGDEGEPGEDEALQSAYADLLPATPPDAENEKPEEVAAPVAAQVEEQGEQQ